MLFNTTRCCSTCHSNEQKLSEFHVRKPKQDTALNVKTEQIVTAKISGNALKQRSRTYSVPWTSAEIFPWGEHRCFAYTFHVADDAMQMDVHKTLSSCFTTRNMLHVVTSHKNALLWQQQPGTLQQPNRSVVLKLS